METKFVELTLKYGFYCSTSFKPRLYIDKNWIEAEYGLRLLSGFVWESVKSFIYGNCDKDRVYARRNGIAMQFIEVIDLSSYCFYLPHGIIPTYMYMVWWKSLCSLAAILIILIPYTLFNVHCSYCRYVWWKSTTYIIWILVSYK